MQDHQIRELVSELTTIAKEYGQTQQLRERIRGAVFKAITPSFLASHAIDGLSAGQEQEPILEMTDKGIKTIGLWGIPVGTKFYARAALNAPASLSAGQEREAIAWVSAHDLQTAQRYGIANATLYRKREQDASVALTRLSRIAELEDALETSRRKNDAYSVQIKEHADAKPIAYLSTDPAKWDQCRINRQGDFTVAVFRAALNAPVSKEPK